jgi:DNA invertase Pin-like site-specific DNA recombinase
MIYGYARISTPRQNLQRQVDNLTAFDPTMRIVQETWSGRASDRPAYGRLTGRVRAGDTIVFDSVSRMSRDADQGVKDYFALFDRGVELVFLKERHIDTSVFKQAAERAVALDVATGDEATDRFMATLNGAVNGLLHDIAVKQIRLAFEQSEKEVADLRQRTREGMAVARAQGKRIGNAEGTTRATEKKRRSIPLILKHSKRYGGTLSAGECMRLCGIGKNAYFRYCREIDAEIVGHASEEEQEGRGVAGD